MGDGVGDGDEDVRGYGGYDESGCDLQRRFNR